MEKKSNTAHIIAIVVLILVIIYFAFVRNSGNGDTATNTATANDAVSGEEMSDSDEDEMTDVEEMDMDDEESIEDSLSSEGFEAIDELGSELDLLEANLEQVAGAETNIFAATPVAVVAQPSAQRVVTLYFPNSGMSGGTSCSAVYPVTRSISEAPRIGTYTLHDLVAGPNPHQYATGYSTDIPRGAWINSLVINSGVATADFGSEFLLNQGSCGLSLRKLQVEKTLLQFPTVSSVVFTVDGLAI